MNQLINSFSIQMSNSISVQSSILVFFLMVILISPLRGISTGVSLAIKIADWKKWISTVKTLKLYGRLKEKGIK